MCGLRCFSTCTSKTKWILWLHCIVLGSYSRLGSRRTRDKHRLASQSPCQFDLGSSHAQAGRPMSLAVQTASNKSLGSSSRSTAATARNHDVRVSRQMFKVVSTELMDKRPNASGAYRTTMLLEQARSLQSLLTQTCRSLQNGKAKQNTIHETDWARSLLYFTEAGDAKVRVAL